MKRMSLLLAAVIMVFLAAWSTPSSSQACEFCNVTGYAVCQTTDGTACSVPGTSKRCIVSPVCLCEWGFCRCDGATGKWVCLY